jgi:hypothetical protein
MHLFRFVSVAEAVPYPLGTIAEMRAAIYDRSSEMAKEWIAVPTLRHSGTSISAARGPLRNHTSMTCLKLQRKRTVKRPARNVDWVCEVSRGLTEVSEWLEGAFEQAARGTRRSSTDDEFSSPHPCPKKQSGCGPALGACRRTVFYRGRWPRARAATIPRRTAEWPLPTKRSPIARANGRRDRRAPHTCAGQFQSPLSLAAKTGGKRSAAFGPAELSGRIRVVPNRFPAMHQPDRGVTLSERILTRSYPAKATRS